MRIISTKAYGLGYFLRYFLGVYTYKNSHPVVGGC
jgi:hypothetical protein